MASPFASKRQTPPAVWCGHGRPVLLASPFSLGFSSSFARVPCLLFLGAVHTRTLVVGFQLAEP